MHGRRTHGGLAGMRILQQPVFDLVLLGLGLRYRVRFIPRTPTVPDSADEPAATPAEPSRAGPG